MSDMDVLKQLRGLNRRMDQTQVKERPAVNAGTANPTGWPEDVPYFRQDLDLWVVYDGTRWLTAQEYPCVLTLSDSAAITFAATTANVRLGALRTDFVPYFTRGQAVISTSGTNNGANFFTYNFVTNGGTTVWSFTTAADGASTTVGKATSTFTQPASGQAWVQLNMVATGAPTAQTPRSPVLFYRLIVT